MSMDDKEERGAPAGLGRPARPAQKAPIALRAVLNHRYTDTLFQNGMVHRP